MKANYDVKKMREERKQAFEAAFKQAIANAYNNGVFKGGRTVSQHIHDQAVDETKTPEERLKEIIDICDSVLKDTESVATINEESDGETDIPDISEGEVTDS